MNEMITDIEVDHTTGETSPTLRGSFDRETNFRKELGVSDPLHIIILKYDDMIISMIKCMII